MAEKKLVRGAHWFCGVKCFHSKAHLDLGKPYCSEEYCPYEKGQVKCSPVEEK